MPPISRRWLTSLALASFLSASCGLREAPPTDPATIGLDLPESWTATPEARAGVDGDWIAELGGQRLKQLVERAWAQNPDLQIAAARRDQARAQGRIADAAHLPKLEVGLDGQRQQQNFVGLPFEDFAQPGAADGSGGSNAGEPSVLSSRSNTFRLHGDLQWELDLWGRIRAGRRANLSEYQASEAELVAAQISLAAEVARAWMALGEAIAQRELASDTLAAFHSTETVLSRRFAAGDDRDSAAAQLRLARSDVATAQADLAQRQAQENSARRQLEILLGDYPDGDSSGPDHLPDPPAPPPAGLPAELLLRRPDLIAAERRFAAAGQRMVEARRAVFPSLRLTASGGTSTDELEQLLNSDYGVWNLAGGLVQPIFRGGEITGEIQRRSAAEDEALGNLQKSVLTAFGEVENALDGETWLRRQQAAVEQAVQFAADADDSARRSYAEGNGDVLTILTAQRQLLQLRARSLQLRRARLENRIGLHLALGGSFKG